MSAYGDTPEPPTEVPRRGARQQEGTHPPARVATAAYERAQLLLLSAKSRSRALSSPANTAAPVAVEAGPRRHEVPSSRASTFEDEKCDRNLSSPHRKRDRST